MKQIEGCAAAHLHARDLMVTFWRASFRTSDPVYTVTWEALSFGADIRRLGSQGYDSRGALSMVDATLQPPLIVRQLWY